MPGFTPTFAIEYPCAGETIDPTVFQTFADDVEAALATVDALNTAALQRPRSAIRDSSTFCAVGVFTPLTFDTTDFAVGVTAGAGGFTLVTDGIYEVSLETDTVGPVVSVTALVGDIQRAGATIYRRKTSPNPALTQGLPLNVSGVFVGTAAQVISFRWGWNGAPGPAMEIVARATIRKLSNL